MKKTIFVFFNASIIFIMLMLSVYADEWGLKTIKGLENQCFNIDYDTYSCSFNIDDLKKFKKFEIYNTFEVSGRLVNYKTKINYIKIPNNTNICLKSFSYLDKPYLFDIKIYKNDELVAETPYIKFIHTDIIFDGKIKKFAEFPCYTINPKDKILFEYSFGEKIQPIEENILGLNLLLNESFYPFDKYKFESWSSLSELYFTRTDKVVLPSSYEVIKNQTILSCPFVVQGNIKDNKFAVFSDMESFGGSFIQTDEKIVTIFPTIISPPIEFIYEFLLMRHNLTQEEFENTFDERTGCNLTFIYKRPTIIKFIFLISVISMLLLSIYYLLIYDNSNWQKISRLFGYSFVVWSFQEGLNSLTPLVRPTQITLFDLTILLPIILSFIYYLKARNRKR
mgnify:CR=1 FL=1